MKQFTPSFLRGLCLFFLAIISSLSLHAETTVRTVTETTTTSSWYASPWVWIGAAIIAILGLSVMLGSGRRTGDGDY